nr:hypothetical protein [Kutzneria chonburiensis]
MSEEPLALLFVLALREKLFELVDDQHRTAVVRQFRQRRERVVAGREDRDRPVARAVPGQHAAGQRRDQPGSQ